MANSGGYIDAPIDVIGDVAKVLVSSSGDVGTLCTHTIGINPWSRHKPVRYNSVAEIGEDELRETCYGLTNVPYFDLPGNMSQFMAGKSIAPLNGTQSGYFVYQPPRGGSYNEPFRITDFDLYHDNAVAPIGKYKKDVLSIPLVGNVYIAFPLGPDDSVRLVRLSDLNIDRYVPATKNHTWYFGLGLTNGTTNYIMTQSTALNDIYAYGSTIHVPRASLASLSGNWTLYAFIVNGKFDTFQTAPSNRSYYWVPLTFTSRTVKIELEAYNITRNVYGSRPTTTGGRVIAYSYSIKNNNTTLFTLTSVKVEVFNSSGVSIGSVTLYSTKDIQSGETLSGSGSVNVNSAANVKSASTITLTFNVLYNHATTPFSVTSSIGDTPSRFEEL